MTAPSLSIVAGEGPPPDAPSPKKFLWTDLGNAERLIDRYGANIHYLPAWGKWLVWDGRRWAIDATLEIQRLAKLTVRGMWKEAAKMGGESGADLAKWANKSESSRAINAMLSRAMAEPGVAIVPAQLDTDPWTLAVLNGQLDLRTGQLGEHDRDALATKLIPVEYDPDARCPRFLAFLHRVMGGNERLMDFLQRAVGYSLTGSTQEQCLFFLYGAGANGKSTFLEVLRALTADYATQADFTTFLERKSDGPRNDVARLFGARVVTSSEVGEGKRLNESLVKSLTGSDTIAARFLFAEAFELTPTFKLWLAANHRPVIRGTDGAIWRRIRLIPSTQVIPEAERDPNLTAALKDELPGILAWAIAGCLRWLEDGLGMPDEVKAATDSYRRDSDTLGAFLEDCCELGDDYAVPAADLYQAYSMWAKEGGEYQVSQTAFGRKLEERGILGEKRGTGSNRVKWRVGVKLQQHTWEQLVSQGSRQRHRDDRPVHGRDDFEAEEQGALTI